jgi:NAD(P)H-dependent FMN reductase
MAMVGFTRTEDYKVGVMSLVRLLAISGSLRAVSSNTTLLQAAAALAPDGIEIVLYMGLGTLPHFNPDQEDEDFPTVRDFRAQLDAADGVLISSPEYAHGVPGSLKNALDWVVGSGELIDKPVALLNATPPTSFAQASLQETLTVMSARVIPEASIALPLRGKNLDVPALIAHPEMSLTLRQALEALVAKILEG